MRYCSTAAIRYFHSLDSQDRDRIGESCLEHLVETGEVRFHQHDPEYQDELEDEVGLDDYLYWDSCGDPL
jgi:hypothetical protein